MAEQAAKGLVVSVNLARIRKVSLGDRLYDTGIWKVPVEHRVAATPLGLEGDKQGDQAAHGGLRKAVYAYADEDRRWWEEQLGRPIEPGSFGENLTVRGVPVTGALIGERWSIGSAELQVTQPREPCWKLGLRMEDPAMPHRFSEANRPGAYLAVVKEGNLGAGDAVEVVHRPVHPITVGLLAVFVYTDHRLASQVTEMLDQDLSSDEWRSFLKAKLA